MFVVVLLTNLITLNFASASQQCDLSKLETTPSNRFEISQDEGIVYDTKTKLTWKKCTQGQNYQEGRCISVARNYAWYGLAFPSKGSEWRLPNDDELKSLVEARCSDPSINLTIFPDTQSSEYWTSLDDSVLSAFAVNFLNGESNFVDKKLVGYVRLVRGEEWSDVEGRKQAEQVDLDTRRRKAPTILRSMTKGDFCVAYGEALRGEKMNEIGMLPDIAKLVKAEARTRKLTFDDSQIRSKFVVIGMSECQLYAVWGRPEAQNRSVGSWGVHVQFVYGGGSYIYLENGRVTSWQD